MVPRTQNTGTSQEPTANLHLARTHTESTVIRMKSFLCVKAVLINWILHILSRSCYFQSLSFINSSWLFDLQDGGVGLHDGDDDAVDIILQTEVDLLLFVDGLHQLYTNKTTKLKWWYSHMIVLVCACVCVLEKQTSVRETLLISAARDSERDSVNRLFAPWILRLIICPFNSSFCSFRLRLSCTQRKRERVTCFSLCLPVWDWIWVCVHLFESEFKTVYLF